MPHPQLTPTDLGLTAGDIKGRFKEDADTLAMVYDVVRNCALCALSDQPRVERTISTWEGIGNPTISTIGYRVVNAGWLKHDQREQARYSRSDALAEESEVTIAAIKIIPTMQPATVSDVLDAVQSLGIGRPSTYAGIFDALTKKKYIQISSDGAVALSESGRQLHLALVESMPLIANVSFTSKVEESLDSIELAPSSEEAEALAHAALDSFWAVLNDKDYYQDLSWSSPAVSAIAVRAEHRRRAGDALIPPEHQLRSMLAEFLKTLPSLETALDDIDVRMRRGAPPARKVLALKRLGEFNGLHEAEELSEFLEFDIRARWFVDYPLDRSAWPAGTIAPVLAALSESIA